MDKIGIILLAAGPSTRLGRPKQLLPYRGGTLLSHAANVALSTELGPVVVVLGAVDEPCRDALGKLPVTIVHNAEWKFGMSSSITRGLEALPARALDGVIVMLCDQPAITSPILHELCAEQRRSSAKIVAASFSGTLGPPALFTADRFLQLLSLRGPGGARDMIVRERFLAMVPCPEAAIDVDTVEDYDAIARL